MSILEKACAILRDRQDASSQANEELKDLSVRVWTVFQKRQADYRNNPADPVALRLMVNAHDFCQKFVFLRDRPDRYEFLNALRWGVEGLEAGQFMTLICLNDRTTPPQIGLIGTFEGVDLEGGADASH